MELRKILSAGLGVFLAVPIVLWSLSLPGIQNSFSFIYSCSRLGALLGMFLFFIQFILGAKLKFIETFFGHDKMVRLHRVVGVVAFLMVLFHAAAVITMRATDFAPYQFSLFLGALAIFLTVMMLLFILIRKLYGVRYEYWEIVHQLNYIIFPIAFIHSILLGNTIRGSLIWQILWGFLAVSFIGILGYKVGNYILVRRNKFQVTRVVQETPNIWTINLQPKKFKFLPGQFMILRLIREGKISEPHPFTIASSPLSDTLAVSIKAAGDFTAETYRTKPGDYALIEAPYGRFSYLRFPSDSYIFIAGGIGITPFLSMLRFMRDNHDAKPVLLLWGNRTRKDIFAGEELQQMEQSLPGLKIVHVLMEGKDWDGETGLVDATLIRKYGGNLIGKEIFLCGPPVMMKMLLQELKQLRISKRKIHFERFTF